MLREKIEKLFAEVDEQVIRSKDQLEEFRIKFLGKKGVMKELFEEFKEVGNEQKKELGALLNRLNTKAQERFNALKDDLVTTTESRDDTDLTLPGEPWQAGSRHPLSIVQNEIIEIFKRLGYNVSYGPEIEDDWHNFSALNFPENHPARDMQDTFFISEDPSIALRTHTSSVQVRVMESQAPPIRTISPGRVYRNEAISARANCFFHQVEGLYIDEKVSFADLKQTLFYFVKEMFGEKVGVRFRPSYFPFTEPSAEMDISCLLCGGKGCNVCKHSGWVEILGCGMVDPAVLTNCGIEEQKYSGFAFGMGIERITMLKYDVNDLRIFFDNDVRFLKQFHSRS